MPVITLHTTIAAPVFRVFDLSRSVDLHITSTARTNEKIVAGRTSGLIELGENVTWRARHFGIYQELKSEITAFNSPHYFVDEMVKGAFKSFKHEHIFKEESGVTLMTDVFDYTSPYGLLGKLADKLFLKRYMSNFLAKRNTVIKQYAEDEALYKKILPL